MQEPNNLGDLLKMEAPQLYSREEVILRKGQNLKLGTVVGPIGTDGDITIFNPNTAGTSTTPTGVLIADIDASEKNTKCVMIARDAVLADCAIVWPKDLKAEQKTVAINKLNDRGIVVRKSA